ncbi:uncharacterized protein LOC119167642 isoform X1 [Rhipicephalus microplus]|uniref:uncharacterized protein LOC119167642 isoform X1 n=1 Tax=Rhipicephalus microplus TaxID=6941 RepID=UPI003F6BB8E2
MASSTLTLYGLGMVAFVVIACSAEEQIPVLGGWQKHNAEDNAIYDELAHFAVSKQVANRQFFDTVLEIVDVESQIYVTLSLNSAYGIDLPHSGSLQQGNMCAQVQRDCSWYKLQDQVQDYGIDLPHSRSLQQGNMCAQVQRDHQGRLHCCNH